MDNIADNISDLLGSLSDDELSSLKETATKLFSEFDQDNAKSESNGDFGISPDMLAKLSNIMSVMNKQGDGRGELISALKPYLSAPRQKKADEAMQFLRLMDILPLIAQSGLFNL